MAYVKSRNYSIRALQFMVGSNKMGKTLSIKHHVVKLSKRKVFKKPVRKLKRKTMGFIKSIRYQIKQQRRILNDK